MKQAIQILLFSLFIAASQATFFQDVVDFDKGLLAGFVNQDLTASDQCVNVTYRVKEQIGTIWDDMLQFSNITKKNESIREVLHIIQKMPIEFKGCKEISGVVEKLAKKVIILLDVTDFAVRAAKNLLYNAFPIMGKLTEASIFAAQKKYYSFGFFIGRAFDMLLE